jgi:hypothetical protein
VIKRGYIMSQKAFFLLLAIMAIPISLQAIEVGVGASYGPTLMGYGKKVYDASSYLGRTGAEDKPTGFNFTAGGEFILSAVQFENDIVAIRSVGMYDLRYSHESYSRTYDNFKGQPSDWTAILGKTDVYNIHALINRLQAGARFDFKTKYPFYAQVTAGALFYNPIYLTLQQWTGDTYNVGIGDTVYDVSLTGNNKNNFFLSLDNASEAMFVGSVRVGMGFIYSEVEVVTNGRITAVNLLLGLDIMSVKGGKIWL